MRYAMIMAGGSGTRLWPMSRADRPKQLIPFIRGKSLLELALERLEGLVPADRRYVCAGRSHQGPIVDELRFDPARYLAEPQGRDTLNAVGFAAAVLERQDPDATIAVFTADHVIEPEDEFRRIVDQGFALVEKQPQTLVTFGIEPTHAATGYGYLELADPIAGAPGQARLVRRFREKPAAADAQKFYQAGPEQFLWNSGMFVWRASTLMRCIESYRPENARGLKRIAEAWGSPDQDRVLEEVYPQLEKISVDFAVMEPASEDPEVQVAAEPMPLSWLDVGSWPAFAKTLEPDEKQNAVSADKFVNLDGSGNIVACDQPDHLVTLLGCENLIVIRTEGATLVADASRAEDIKKLHAQVGERFPEHL